MEGEIGEKEKHSRVKHSCIICGKLFQSRSALLIHEKIHTGEKSLLFVKFVRMLSLGVVT